MSYFSHENIAVLLPGRLPKGYWEVHRIKDMRVMDGKREWLIVRAGVMDEETGEPRAGGFGAMPMGR